MDFKQQAQLIALRDMFNRGSFSICPVREIAEANGLPTDDNPEFVTIKHLHCVKFSDMGSDFKTELVLRTLSVCGFHPTTNLLP